MGEWWKGSLVGEVIKVAVCNQVIGSLKARGSLNCSAISLILSRDFDNISLYIYWLLKEQEPSISISIFGVSNVSPDFDEHGPPR